MNKNDAIIDFIENVLGCKLLAWQKEFCKKLASADKNTKIITGRKGFITVIPAFEDNEPKQSFGRGRRAMITFVDEIDKIPSDLSKEIKEKYLER